MPSVKKRTGRKPEPYVCDWNNETIDGLYLCPDGRWRITATGEKFRQPNPRLAVARFREWQAQQRGDQKLIPLPFHSLVTAVSSDCSPSQRNVAYARLEALVREVLGSGDHPNGKDRSLSLRIPETSDPVQWLRAIPEDAYHACVADDIRNKGKYMAERTGIEQLGYLHSLEKPQPSPSLKEVGEYFLEKKKDKMSSDWFGKCKAHWKEFSDCVGVRTVREVTRQHVEDYGEMVAEAVREHGYSPTYTRQRLEAIRSIANFPLKKLKGEADCRRLHNWMSILD